MGTVFLGIRLLVKLTKINQFEFIMLQELPKECNDSCGTGH